MRWTSTSSTLLFWNGKIKTTSPIYRSSPLLLHLLNMGQRNFVKKKKEINEGEEHRGSTPSSPHDIHSILTDYEPKFSLVIEKLTSHWTSILPGKANPNFIHTLPISLHRSQTLPLESLAQITLKDPLTLLVRVLKEEHIKPIVTALQKCSFHFNPILEHQTVLKIPLPRPSQETRVQATKQIALTSEKAKGEVRQLRQKALQFLKKAQTQLSLDEQRRLEKQVQVRVDHYCKHIEQLEASKIKEISLPSEK
ncbi:hypothetical protein HMI54_006216 [Coelomomyces lativittatus]|nr:hypothetical protein HMI55_000892 [Coelomomyces lativittatus]KAJ1517294.1 hypothetical protein HMI54_006216 [Coelomomyces lativittatus]